MRERRNDWVATIGLFNFLPNLRRISIDGPGVVGENGPSSKASGLIKNIDNFSGDIDAKKQEVKSGQTKNSPPKSYIFEYGQYSSKKTGSSEGKVKAEKRELNSEREKLLLQKEKGS